MLDEPETNYQNVTEVDLKFVLSARAKILAKLSVSQKRTNIRDSGHSLDVNYIAAVRN